MLEQTKAEISRLLQEISERPDEREILQDSLRSKIDTLRNHGHPIPDDILRLQRALDDPDDDEFWDNMPV